MEIFKNPQNHARPPSEYLEIFHEFTEKLHHLQMKRQQILDRASKIDFLSTDKFSPSKNVFPPVEFRKPPLPPNKTPMTPIEYQPPATTVGTTHYQQTPQTPTSPYNLSTNGLYPYKSISSANSPVTTPGYSPPPPIAPSNPNDHIYQQSHMSTSTSSSSLPSFVTNHANLITNHPNNLALTNGVNTLGSSLSHNSSRSFSDINEALNQYPIQIAINNNYAITPYTATSISSSLATTPTSYTTLSSSFLRIFIGSSTAVVMKSLLY